jgi:hypothetical protein
MRTSTSTQEYQELVERQRGELVSLGQAHKEVKEEARRLRERLLEDAEAGRAAGQTRERLQQEMSRLLCQLEYR